MVYCNTHSKAGIMNKFSQIWRVVHSMVYVLLPIKDFDDNRFCTSLMTQRLQLAVKFMYYNRNDVILYDFFALICACFACSFLEISHIWAFSDFTQT